MKIICFFVGHINVWNNGDPKCIRRQKPHDHEQFMLKHSQKKSELRFRW